MRPMKKLYNLIGIMIWLAIVVFAAVVGLLSWVFYRKPRARCPKCGRKMKKHNDESFGVWTCSKCNN